MAPRHQVTLTWYVTRGREVAAAYALIGLIFCVRLVVQADFRPAMLAAGYSFGFAIVWPLVGVHWLVSLVCAVTSFGPAYLYLRGLEVADGWRFWALLPAGIIAIGIPQFVAETVSWAFGVTP